MHAYVVEFAELQNWFAAETLESSAINDELSMLAMFLTVLYMIVGLRTETLK